MTAAETLAALRGSPPLEIAERREALGALAAEVLRRGEEIAAAVDADYGGRSRTETLLADVRLVADAALHARRHVARWARPRRVGVPYPFWPARAWVEPQAKGVVGIMAPWNYPVQLALVPAVDAIAAGNRVVVKASEHVPRTAALIAEILDRAPGAAIARAVLGGPDVAAEFAAQPWDHLVFTGGTATGRKVMQAAAANLVPLTLELGGKCPVLVLPGADLARAAKDILVGKALNAGQTCIAPDTVLLVGHSRADFLRGCRASGIAQAETSVANAAQAARVASLTEGATMERLGADARAIAIAAPGGSRLNDEEIFGPVLAVEEYARLDDAIAWIVARPSPLAIYLFGATRAEEARVAAATRSGALVCDRTVEYAAFLDLPFGGVGGSGFGRYRGRAGFEEFTNLRARVRHGRWSLSRLLDPPRGALAEKILKRLLG
jgi:acyl-CoA reductase-like NAD-dependent aldehyde dehydrogenase